MNPEHYAPAFLLTLLSGDNPTEIKARACQQLAHTGGPEAVPALAALLADDALSAFARTALENIPGPAAGEALRAALSRLTGTGQAGVIDSLGARRDVAAVPALQALVTNTADGIASAALSALAKITTPEALATLRQTVATGSAAAQIAAAHAALAAAQSLIARSQRTSAEPLLQAVLAASVPAHVRTAAQGLLLPVYIAKTTRRLFDGKSFAGWEGDLTYFRIEDGAVKAGRLDRPIPQNEFLATTAEFADFELRLKVRLLAEKGNAGIQFRSQRVAGSREMIGYQADVSPEFWGALYDESRRRTFLGVRPEPALIRRALKPDAWNAYTIRCEGPRVRLWLNGQLTVDFTETLPGAARTGRLGLQIHSGPATEAWYQDIELTDLTPGL